MVKINGQQALNHFSKKEKVLGQFFTPKEVVDFILDFILINSDKKEKAVDPACGDGIFLEGLIERGFKEIIGVDVDSNIVASIPYKIKNNAKIINADGLLFEPENCYDVIVSNPPFSAKYGRVQNKDILSRFELGKGTNSQPIEILFLEKFIRLASENGIIGVVLPFGIISNNNLKSIRKYIFKHTKVLAVVSLPRFIFNGSASTSSKTCLLFLQKRKTTDRYKIFMSIVNSLEELKEVINLFVQKREKENLSFWVEIKENNLTPEFYNPEYRKVEEELLNCPFKTERLKYLIDEMFCGRTEYESKRTFSKEGIPFISAKTITNFGIDFSNDRKFISKNSEMFKPQSLVKKNDIIFVRVGVGCIGRTVVVTSKDEYGAVDDWSYVIRTKKNLSPYFLAFYLQTKYGKIQLERIKRGVGTVTIPQSSLKEILVPIFEDQKIFKELYLKMRRAYKDGLIDDSRKLFEKAIKTVEETIKG